MKKILFLIFLAIIIQYNLYSQTELGLYAGIDNGKLSGDKFEKTKYSSKVGYLIGINIEQHISDLISLSFQPGYLQTGSKIQVPDTVENEYKDSLNINKKSIQFPIYVKIQSKSKRLYFSSGLEFGYGISLKADNTIDEIDLTDELKRWSLAIGFGIGYKIPIKRSILNFELRYVQGLLNVTDPDPDVDYHIPRVKLSGLRLIVGFQIPVIKKK